MGSKEKYNFKYEVDAAQNHSGGFTLYKILIKEFKTTGPLEHICEQVVWKRYNDFKYLHRDLFILHKELYLSGRFPGFVKPKIFGRFDEKVINERMKCAQCLLDFAIQHKPLYSSKAFKQFFINAKPVEKISEVKRLKEKPIVPKLLESNNQPEDDDSGEIRRASSLRLDAADFMIFDPFSYQNSSENVDAAAQSQWCEFAHDPTSFTQSETGSCDVINKQVNSDTNKSDEHNKNEEMNKDNGEHVAFEGSTNTPIVTTSLSLQEQVIPSDIPQLVQELEPDSTQKLNSEEMTNSQGFSSPAHVPQPASFSLGGDTLVAASSSNQIDEGFVLLPKITRTNSIEIAKEKHRKSSKARAYLNKVRESLPDIFDDKTDSVKQDASQSNGFRKIVSAYELRPEHNPSHSASNSFMDLKRFFMDSEKTEKPPTYRHSSSDLLNYKVLGVTGRVMLVMDNSTNKTFALKIIQKSSHRNFRVRKAVIPTNVPYMVRMYRYYSLEGCICLLLEYAAGGRLWDQLSAYSVVCNEGMVPQEPEPTGVEIDREACKEENGGNNVTESSQVELNTSDDIPEVSNDEISSKVPKDELDPDNENLSDEMMSDAAKIDPVSPRMFTIDSVSTLSNEDSGSSCEDQVDDPFLLSEQDLSFVAMSGASSPSLIRLRADTSSPCLSNTSSVDDGICNTNKPGNTEVDEHGISTADATVVFSRSNSSVVEPKGDTTIEESTKLSMLIEQFKDNNDDVFPESVLDSSSKNKDLIEDINICSDLIQDGAETCSSNLILNNQEKRTNAESETSDNSTEMSNHRLKGEITSDTQTDGRKIVNEAISNDQKKRSNSAFEVFRKMEKIAHRRYRIPESIIKLWSAEIVVAVGTLHSVGILCRNLNPDNILLSHNGRIRLSYFGKWKNVEHCDRFLSKSGYTAPEMTSVINKKTEACDWWSVGAIIYELLVGKPLIKNHPSSLGSHDNLSLPSFVSVEGKSLLRGLLRYYPTERLGYGVTGLDEIMAHPFYRGVDWNQLIEEYQESV